MPERSLDVAEPPLVDVVVAEVLGNFAYEEDVLETLRDAQRFLKPGGTLIPASIAQWVAPVISDRFERDLCTWRDVGFDLDWSDAEHMSSNNMYVYPVEPQHLLPNGAKEWDAVDFTGAIDSQRSGSAAWSLDEPQTLYGFALWWDCMLAPGVRLSTSPYAPRTHWDQIYLPLLTPISAERGDQIALTIEAETGGGESGIDVRWAIQHARGGRPLGEQALSIGAGWLA